MFARKYWQQLDKNIKKPRNLIFMNIFLLLLLAKIDRMIELHSGNKTVFFDIYKNFGYFG